MANASIKKANYCVRPIFGFDQCKLGDGPDGALYVVDMNREVIEHPKSLPPINQKAPRSDQRPRPRSHLAASAREERGCYPCQGYEAAGQT